MQPTDSALLFTDLPSAQARSLQLATNIGCDEIFTKYWWECIQLTNGQGALIVRSTGKFGSKPGPTALSQLTPIEITALQSYAAVQSLLPVSTAAVAIAST
jgi:hypothetical protein